MNTHNYKRIIASYYAGTAGRNISCHLGLESPDIGACQLRCRLFCVALTSMNRTCASLSKNLTFKNELGGRSRAKAGIMQRISMVALRATARQVIRGVALVGAANVQAHN